MISSTTRSAIVSASRAAAPTATRAIVRAISTTRIISTAANTTVQPNDVSHFKTFKEYRLFAQQFGPLASHGWEHNIAIPTTAAAAAAAATKAAEAVENSVLESVALGGVSN